MVSEVWSISVLLRHRRNLLATKRLPLKQIRKILQLKHEQKLNHRAIASACRVGLGTVVDYLGRARQAGLEWPLPSELDEAALEARLFPHAGPGSRERVPPDVELINQELKRVGVTLHLLWEEYREPMFTVIMRA